MAGFWTFVMKVGWHRYVEMKISFNWVNYTCGFASLDKKDEEMTRDVLEISILTLKNYTLYQMQDRRIIKWHNVIMVVRSDNWIATVILSPLPRKYAYATEKQMEPLAQLFALTFMLQFRRRWKYKTFIFIMHVKWILNLSKKWSVLHFYGRQPTLKPMVM